MGRKCDVDLEQVEEGHQSTVNVPKNRQTLWLTCMFRKVGKSETDILKD